MRLRVLVHPLLLVCTLACLRMGASTPIQEPAPLPVENATALPTAAAEPSDTLPMSGNPSTAGEDLIQPADLVYLGAFRLPDVSGSSNWEYSGRSLTYFPAGDPSGPDDGFPGSLFMVGNDQQEYVSEISIPAPVNSKIPADLPEAATLQPFADITGGMMTGMDLPRLGIQYLPVTDSRQEVRIHFVFGQHFQDYQPSHGWSGLDLADPQPDGPWMFTGYTNYVTSDYVLEIPAEWSARLPGSPRLATGRFREGVWGGFGPALFAYNPTESGDGVKDISALLLYGTQEPGAVEITTTESTRMDGYNADDSWWGGAWLTAGQKSAMIFTGTKASGKSWYGFANGVLWDYDCAERNPPTCPEVPEWPYDNRGYWAENYSPEMLFFNPADLIAVSEGRLNTWDPQPYAMLNLSDVFLNPVISLADYKTDIAGSVTFDRERGLLFVVERLGEGYKSIIHVWKVK